MINKIRECFGDDRLYYSQHARDEMEGEESGEILDEEIFETVLTGKIIESSLKMNHIRAALFMVEQNKIDLCMWFVHIQKMKNYRLS